ncbi:glycosidase [Roseomonas fluvialis]|uniref:Glycosidase n=1 Tax=Roseomonas fluvialis TaxID=1750527 RepID=A0ABM7XY91_9PROT|nr:glycosidase [Roseomonas fluvialis]
MVRLPILIEPDASRVILRPFLSALDPRDLHRSDLLRATRLIDRILAMDTATVEAEMATILDDFGTRHADLTTILTERYAQIRDLLGLEDDASEARRLLIGAFFSNEYSFQSTALFNPSIVPHPDQAGLDAGEVRFVMSLRATGEGHISSICFSSGIVTAAGTIRLDPPGRLARTPRRSTAVRLADDYDVTFSPGTELGERVIFPITQQQRNGIEDARLVRFVEDDGNVSYFATYTAYSGREIAPEMLRTDDFRRFSFVPLRGDAVNNKGMALFPRRIAGRYVMLARSDGETLQVVRSDDLHVWNDATEILAAAEPWEFVQIGNCGSPIELPEGWLVITHGVGAMRRYCISAALLDLNDPSRMIARLRKPMLTAIGDERNGYVPNVVYSCGSMVHEGQLILPYAASDTATRFAVIPVASLIDAMG